MEALMLVVHAVIIVSISFFLWKKERHSFFWPALFFKLLAGVLVGLLYRYYYSTGDTWAFFNDGVSIADSVRQHPNWFIKFFWNDDFSILGTMMENDRPRSVYLVKWVAFFNLLDQNNYWITSLYFSFTSFFASWVLFQTLTKYFSGIRVEAAIAVLFIPSVIFWGSGIIKESLAIASLFGITAWFISWYFNRRFSILKIIAGLISFWILWNLKYYWAGVWLAVVVPVILIQWVGMKIKLVHQNPKWSWFMLLIIVIAGISIIHPNFYYDRILAVIVENHDAYLRISNSGGVIHFYNLQPSVFSLFMNSPWALFSGIFRPTIFEAGNFLQTAASLENLILLVLLLMSLIHFRIQFNPWNELHLAMAAYIILLASFLALSTPNLGSLSRFKIGFTPFLWLALLYYSGIVRIVSAFYQSKFPSKR